MVRTIASRSAQRPSHRTCDGAARDPPTCATCAIATSALRRPPQSPRRCACSGTLNRSCPSEVKSGPCSLTGRPYAHLQARSHVRAPSGRTELGCGRDHRVDRRRRLRQDPGKRRVCVETFTSDGGQAPAVNAGAFRRGRPSATPILPPPPRRHGRPLRKGVADQYRCHTVHYVPVLNASRSSCGR